MVIKEKTIFLAFHSWWDWFYEEKEVLPPPIPLENRKQKKRHWYPPHLILVFFKVTRCGREGGKIKKEGSKDTKKSFLNKEKKGVNILKIALKNWEQEGDTKSVERGRWRELNIL